MLKVLAWRLASVIFHLFFHWKIEQFSRLLENGTLDLVRNSVVDDLEEAIAETSLLDLFHYLLPCDCAITKVGCTWVSFLQEGGDVETNGRCR